MAVSTGDAHDSAHGDAPEFHSERGVFWAEYERELGQWLRRRLGWLCIAYAVFQILGTTSLVLTTRWAAEEIRAERAEIAAARARTAASSPLDAVGEIARDLAREVRPDADAVDAPRPAPIGRAVDRWWEQTIAPITDAKSESDEVSGGNAEKSTEANADATTDTSGAAAEDSNADRGVNQGRATDRGELDADAPSRAAETDAPLADTAEQDTAANEGADAESAQTTAELPIVLRLPWWFWFLANLPSLGVIFWFGLRIRPQLYTRNELVTASSRMIVILGFMTFALETAMLLASPDSTVTPLFSIFFWHLTASLFLPWSWRESLRPIVPLFLAWILLRAGLAAGNGDWIAFVLTVVFAPVLFVPALVVCYARLKWHRNRFKTGFVGRRFLAMRREFQQARAVHESLFPKPMDLGWLRFDFGYRPAADIGGDFVHAWTDDDGRFHMIVLDVTGHGLASAMSVARIYGEIERLRDEFPEDGPARMLRRLNRYFRRLLARHKLFATATMVSVDARTGELSYASAGHPPMFVRSRGQVREFESTTFLLGAVDDNEFGESETVVRLTEGDTVVLFTDGAFDAKNPRGERFGLDRLREILRRPNAPTRWPQFIMRLVETFEAGMPEDDLIVAEIVFLARRSMYSGITGDAPPSHEYAGTGL